jgi:hypothetical protein
MRPVTILLALLASIAAIASNTGTNFEFAKSVYKIKGTIKQMDDNFVIVPDGSRDQHFLPAYLPDEYKQSGIKVTFDGDLGKGSDDGTAVNIHKIWVEYTEKERFNLSHKSYDLN